MTGNREAVLTETANLLLDARRTGETLVDLPAENVPADLTEAYAVQDKIAAAFGEVGGWKIGAPTPEATPIFGPMPRAWMAESPATLEGTPWRYRGLEAEIAFLVGEDLPPRETPYTRDEVVAAMASCHPVIEELETAYVDPTVVSRMAMIADLHGAFVIGPAIADWQSIDFTAEKVTLAVDGIVRVERTGSNTSGDFVKLLPWLANEGAGRTGGLRKGQWITTGSWTGNTLASAGSVVVVEFAAAGRVDLRFA
jgi:2-keto-4-pentenoate hydratase